MTAPSRAALAERLEGHAEQMRCVWGDLPVTRDLDAAAALLREPLDREALCLTEEEHEEAYAQFRRLDAAGDPYALDKLLVHWAHRLRPRLARREGRDSK